MLFAISDLGLERTRLRRVWIYWLITTLVNSWFWVEDMFLVQQNKWPSLCFPNVRKYGRCKTMTQLSLESTIEKLSNAHWEWFSLLSVGNTKRNRITQRVSWSIQQILWTIIDWQCIITTMNCSCNCSGGIRNRLLGFPYFPLYVFNIFFPNFKR